MKMRKNISKVISAFRAGKSAYGDSKKTCWTDGKTIYSYNMPIAKRIKRPSGAVGNRGIIQIVEYDRAPTNTTRGQVSAVRMTFKNLDDMYKIVWVQKVK